MSVTNKIIKSVKQYRREMKKDPNHRFYSWDHCYKVFCDARQTGSQDYDYLSLHLAFYLASWGMIRGSSNLLNKDYKVHLPAVKIILRKKYGCLLGFEYTCDDQKKMNEAREKLEDLKKKLTECYNSAGVSPTGTLISKIILGTLGCTPGYDTFFHYAVNDKNNITELLGKDHPKLPGNKWDIDSLFLLAEYYRKNSNDFEALRKEYKVFGVYDYPQMKLLDMGLWQIGQGLKPPSKKNAREP